MVKISDYLNTELRTAPTETGQAFNVVQQLASQANQGEGNLVNQKINQATSLENQRRNDAMQQQQIQALAANKMNEIYSGLQTTQLKMIGTLALIDEKNKQQQEKAQSTTYGLTAITGAKLDSDQYLIQLQNQPGDGSSVLPQTQKYVNEQINNILANAPSDRAKADLMPSLTKHYGDILGQGIKIADEKRVNYNANNIENSTKNLEKNLYSNPDDSSVYEMLPALQKAMEVSGMKPDQASAQNQKIAERLYQANIDGYLQKGDFGKAKGFLYGALKNDFLNASQITGMANNIATLEEKTNKELLKQQENVQSVTAYNLNQFEPLTATTQQKDAVREYTFQQLNGIKQQLDSGQIDDSGFINKVTNFIAQRPNYVDPTVMKVMAKGISSGEDLKMAANYTQILSTLANNPDTSNLIQGLSPEELAPMNYVAEHMGSSNINDVIKEARTIQGTDPQNPIYKARSEMWKSDVSKTFAAYDVQSDIIDKTNMSSWFHSEPDYNTDMVKSDHMEYAKRAFLQTGDVNTAKRTADMMINLNFGKSSVNTGALMSNGQRITTEAMESAPEMIYQSPESMKVFMDKFQQGANEIATANGWTTDWKNRQFVKEDGSRTGFRVTSIAGVTKSDMQRNQGTTRWDIVGSDQGIVPERFSPKSLEIPFDQSIGAIIQKNREQRLNAIDHIEARSRDFVSNISNVLINTDAGKLATAAALKTKEIIS